MKFNNISTVLFLSFISTSLAKYFKVTDQVYFDVSKEGEPLGRIVIGLFGEIAPKTVKNFKHIASKGIKGKTYVGSKFHRVVKRFMIQGGDIISRDGKGSISIYGKEFEDENFEIDFSVSGLVAMANRGKDTNGCQFFITTLAAPWLNGLHTVFGKVVEGQNIVHMIEHIPVDIDDRPTYEIKIEESGIVPTPSPFEVSNEPYDLWAWIKASAVPLTMSFSILGLFHYFIRKMEIS